MPILPPIQIPTNDLYPNRGMGIDIPFNKPGVFTSNYLTKDTVKNNLINFFLTNKEERYMNPTFGGGLRDFIFEQISNDNVANLQSQIQDQLNVFFPKVEVINLEVGSNPDDYTISVFLKYAVKNTNIIDNITIDFNK